MSSKSEGHKDVPGHVLISESLVVIVIGLLRLLWDRFQFSIGVIKYLGVLQFIDFIS